MCISFDRGGHCEGSRELRKVERLCASVLTEEGIVGSRDWASALAKERTVEG